MQKSRRFFIMAFCKYCGTQYPDGGSCTNPACTGANQAPAVNPNTNPFAQTETSAQPSKKTSKGVFIALALVVVLIIAAVVVLVLVLNNKKKDDKKKADSHKSAVESYAENRYDKNGFTTVSELTMLEDVYKKYKKSDNFDDDKDDHKEWSIDMKDMDISVDSVKKVDKLSDDALDAAEEYFEDQAEDYDVDIDDIEVSDGYEYKIKFEYKEDDEKDTTTQNVCAVKVKGDGWKIITMDAEDLEYYYG